MSVRGRLPKLTPDVEQRVVEALRLGNVRRHAAALAGIHRATLFRWLAKGRKQRRGIYRDFCDAIKKAEGEAIALNMASIQTASHRSWQAAAWWLERRYSEQYGNHSLELAMLRKELRQLKRDFPELVKRIDGR
jgi:hypothetical protein